jgi:hypothetical protein
MNKIRGIYMTKEVKLCNSPKGCCAKVQELDNGGISIEEDITGVTIALSKNEWQVLKDKVKSGAL